MNNSKQCVTPLILMACYMYNEYEQYKYHTIEQYYYIQNNNLNNKLDERDNQIYKCRYTT